MMNYFIVDSVKGGCGKSTIALWKALKLKSESKKNKCKVCYVDLDILGTSMESFIGCRKDTNAVYLNDLFKGERNAVKKKKVTSLLKFNIENRGSNQLFSVNFNNTVQESEKVVEISAIFCSPEQTDKNLFRPNYLTGGQCIDYTFFALRLKELFEELKDGGYTDIVIDMPPNSDSYTDSVFDLLLHRTKSSSPPRDWKVTFLLISTFDSAHIQANVNWCEGLLRKDHDWYQFNEVECYFNDVRNDFSNGIIDYDTKPTLLPSVTPGVNSIARLAVSDFTCCDIIRNKIKKIQKCNLKADNLEVQVFTVGHNKELSLSAINAYTTELNASRFGLQSLQLGLPVNQISLDRLK